MVRRVVCALMVLAACTSSAASPPPRTVVVFGDSIVDGYWLPDKTHNRWTALLEPLIHSAVVTQGFNAATVISPDPNGKPTMLQRFDSDVLAVPGVTDVVIAGGVNDLYHSPDEQIAAGILSMAAKAAARGLRVLLLPILPETDGRYDGTKVNALLRASRFPVCPTDAAMSLEAKLNPAYALEDGIHPNVEGNRVMADVVGGCLMSRAG